MIISWIKGVLKHRWGQIMGAVCGVAITVSLIASISIFITESGASMTKRAIENIPVDWQVQAVSDADINTIKAAIGQTTGYSIMEKVGYADVAGLQATTDGTVQTTGAGKVLGISDSYIKNYPSQFRQLLGSNSGVLVAQQTAANLHIKLGDEITIMRTGLPPAIVKVNGIVDLPNADSLFQGIGLPIGAAPQAPPDNVLIIPQRLWHSLFDPQAALRPDLVKTQLHVKIDHNFSADPNTSYKYVLGKANNLEARIAGNGIVGDNIAARLSAVREDALYSKILFLFLGFPGALLAILLTLIIAASGEKHRKQEQAILRIYGASTKQIIKLEALESIVIALMGIVSGFVITILISTLYMKNISFNDNGVMVWLFISGSLGLILSLTAVLLPTWKETRSVAILQVKKVRITKKPIWQRLYIDVLFLAISAFVYWQTAITGYQVVLAPEGVTAISVNYFAFIAPFCLWVGGVLLAVRLCRLFMEHGKRSMSAMLKPIAKRISDVVAASMIRERTFMIRGIVLVALAISFAVSTSIFNTTYNAQSRVDAQLTNGSDVTITSTIPFTKNDTKLSQLSSLSGVKGLQVMQHRFAYVGNDLQDIYGIDSNHISDATNVSNAYFANGNAKAALSTLAGQEDGVLVSQETVIDFQLQEGDTINLRLQNTVDHKYHVVPFHFVGIIREFATAPKDSFLVANASYISKATGSDASEVVLMRVSGNATDVATRAKAIVGKMGITVSDLGSVQKVINSGLTAVDLHGLTSIELIYAILLVALAVGLLSGLRLAERKRSFAILEAIGAKDKHLGAFIWSEGLFMLIIGGGAGTILGVGIAEMLVKVLTGVFDPPPEWLSFPWIYLGVLFIVAIFSTIFTVYIIKQMSKRPAVEELRNS